jgi:hypothetical protein
MIPSYLIAVLGFATSIYGNAIPNAASPATVPEATPSGCSKGAFSLSPSEIKKATAGCEGISREGGVNNDIIDALPCKPVTLLFARGTGETGNIGQLVGPPFVLALEKEFGKGNVAVQGVNDYPAVPLDYCSGGRAASGREIERCLLLT